MCCLFFGIMMSMFMTMYFSHISGVNVGIISTIWSVQPLIAAIIDWIIYREKLKLNHYIGMVLVVLGALAIGFAGILKTTTTSDAPNSPTLQPPNANTTNSPYPELHDTIWWYSWIAIIWAVITPAFFLAQSFFTKYVVQPKYNFDAKTISFGTSSFTCFFVLIVGVTWYWRT